MASKGAKKAEPVECPECKAAGLSKDEYTFWNTKALGGHRRWKHGVKGSSRNAKVSPATVRTRVSIGDGSEKKVLLNAMEEMAQELNRLWALEDEYKRVVGLAKALSEETVRAITKVG